MHRRLSSLTVLSSALALSAGMAAADGPGSDTRLFAGLSWSFGAKSGPALQLGAIYADTDAGNDVTGARGYLNLSLSGGRPQVVVTGFAGTTDVVGEIGLGYEFDGGGVFGQFGALGDYWAAGGTYGFGDGGWSGYIGLHSHGFDEVDMPAGGHPDCIGPSCGGDFD
jgi:hypothetical protein